MNRSSTPAVSNRGVAAALGAYTLWGVVPLYWPLLNHSSALEVLAHRILWSVVFGIGLVAVFARRRWRAQLADRRMLARMALAAVLVSANWGIYIWAVTNGHVTETALGYYINPLLSILIGVVLLSERLAPIQWVAIGLATVAVVVITVDYGRPPWVALGLAISFGLYGAIKKGVTAEPIVSFTYESTVVLLPAVAFIVFLGSRGEGNFLRWGVGYDLLLVGGGLVTAVPLLLFAFAAQKIPLSLLGITQYLGPTLQFLVAILIRHEPMSPARWIGFVIVWVALVIITAHALVRGGRNRRARQREALAD